MLYNLFVMKEQHLIKDRVICSEISLKNNETFNETVTVDVTLIENDSIYNDYLIIKKALEHKIKKAVHNFIFEYVRY